MKIGGVVRAIGAALAALLLWSAAPVVLGDEAAAVHEIDVGDFFFDPDDLEAEPGDTIRWSWEAGTHTVTAYEGATFDSDPRSAPDTFEWTYEGGTVRYYCQIHSSVSDGECSGPQCGVIREPPPPPPTPDPDAPVIIDPPEGAALATSTVTVGGASTDPGATVEVRSEGTAIGTAVADGSGSWTVQIAFADGEHVITAVVLDGDGNPGPESPPRTFVVDTVPPDVTITRPGPTLHVLDVNTGVPTEGPVAAGPVTVRAHTGAPISGVSEVSFAVDGAPVDPGQVTHDADADEFRFVLRSGRLGPHTVTAGVVGGSGLTGTDTIEVFVVPAGP